MLIELIGANKHMDKSGNTRANSLKSFIKEKQDISCGYKFIDGNIGVGEDGIVTLPLYMIAFV